MRACFIPSATVLGAGLLVATFVSFASPASAHAQATPVEVLWQDGLRLRADTDSGRVEIRLGGRLHLDTTFGFARLEDDPDSTNAFEPRDGMRVRRARLQLRGTLFDVSRFNLHLEFSSGAPVFTDAHFGFNVGPGSGELVVGLQRAPFSLVNMIGANNRPMMESSFVSQLFAPARQLGLGYTTNADAMFNAQAGFFRATSGAGTFTSDPDAWLVGGRAWASLLHDSDAADLHAGLAVSHWFLNDRNQTFRTRPTIFAEPGSRPLSREVEGLDGNTLFGAELAYLAGALRVLAEVAGAHTTPHDSNDDSTFLWGVSATIGYLLNGGTQRYIAREGKLANPRVGEPFNGAGQVGLFEVLANFDYADLGDGHSAIQAALGLNWYMNNNMRLMLNLAWMNVNGDGSYYLAGMRLQFNV